eukprot:TRINITY_DN14949_c0_g1_i1.p1 TRINITY_DN14949_c0_g1~~TRINITY_DN14949_c0_g1_i1.p1  ORF type:complete len:176 (+),score=14.07 TRINITY_DN14949_c0_g1_i1:692-1219(+)
MTGYMVGVDVFDAQNSIWTHSQIGIVNSASSLGYFAIFFGDKITYFFDSTTESWTNMTTIPFGKNGAVSFGDAVMVLDGNIVRTLVMVSLQVPVHHIVGQLVRTNQNKRNLRTIQPSQESSPMVEHPVLLDQTLLIQLPTHGEHGLPPSIFFLLHLTINLTESIMSSLRLVFLIT